MSISSAMLAGVTGLVSNSSALAAISDNIANSNTVGYKRVGVDFTSLVNAGATGEYAAGGVSTATQHFITQQGSLQATSSATDLAISGNGFFVTSGKAAGLTASDPRYFTRAGAFTIDQSGYLKNAAGLYLQGWLADSGGVITPDSANLTSLQPINILQVAATAQPTTSGTIDANVNADQAISSAAQNAGAGTVAAPGYNPDVNPATAPATEVSMTEYANDPTTGVKPDFSITVPVSDSKGGSRNLVVDFLKSSTANQWYAEVRADPPSTVETDPNLPQGLIESGIVAFKPDGTLDTAATTLSTSLSLGPSSAAAPVAGAGESAAKWATNLGISGQSISLDISKISQLSAPSSVAGVTTNGTASGGIAGVSIDNQGKVTAVFDNGTTRTLAQVAIATFPNPDGLQSVDGDAYQETLSSGALTLKTAGSAGAGAITPSSLEASTVDLSSEFTGLITTQQAYSAASKIISTADQMIQVLLGLKQ
jgi:flagellar hook protein FlgE